MNAVEASEIVKRLEKIKPDDNAILYVEVDLQGYQVAKFAVAKVKDLKDLAAGYNGD